jgi:hypothetical protein
MLYGTVLDNDVVVASADNAGEFADFVTVLGRLDTHPSFRSFRVADFLEVMMDERLAGFSAEPLIVSCDNATMVNQFVEEYQIVLLKSAALRDHQRDMVTAGMDDQFSADSRETRSIAEIYGLDKNDPFDRRTAEEVAADLDVAKKIKEAKDKGRMGAESFGGEGAGNSIRVKSVNMTRETHGSLTLNSATVMQNKKAAVMPDDERLEIDYHGIIAIFNKVDVADKKLEDVLPDIADAFNLEKLVIDKRNCSTGCWFVVPTQRQAEDICKALTEKGYTVETYAVKQSGARVLPKGMKVVEEELPEETKFLPWEDRAAWDALDEDGRKNVIRKVRGTAYVMCGYYDPRKGADVYIVPRKVFNQTNDFWPESLPLEGMLPQGLVEVSPGHYHCRYESWVLLAIKLNEKGFRESIPLQLLVNSL